MKAFDEIYNNYVNDIFRYLMILTKSPNLAEELTQETFYKAYKNIDKFEGKSKMSVWLCQIAKNAYYSYLGKEKRIDYLAEDERLKSTINIEAEFINTENSISIHKIIHTLDDPYKEVFNLRLFGELSFKHIGEIFDKSESWARVTYYRAKEKIKMKFNEKEVL